MVQQKQFKCPLCGMRSWTSRLYNDPILNWYDYHSVGRRNGVKGCFVWQEMNIDTSTQELFNRKFLDCLSLMLEEEHIKEEDVVRILKGYEEQREDRPEAEEKKKEKFTDPVDMDWDPKEEKKKREKFTDPIDMDWTPKIKKALDSSIKKVDKLKEKKEKKKRELFSDPVDDLDWTPKEDGSEEEEDDTEEEHETCPECGGVVYEGDTKCSNCGYVLEEEKEKFTDPVDMDWTPE